MQIVSFYFFVFLFITILLYYILPKNKRFLILLISSVVFFLLACNWKMIFYLLIGIVSTYIGTRYIHEKCDTIKKTDFIYYFIFYN